MVFGGHILLLPCEQVKFNAPQCINNNKNATNISCPHSNELCSSSGLGTSVNYFATFVGSLLDWCCNGWPDPCALNGVSGAKITLSRNAEEVEGIWIYLWTGVVMGLSLLLLLLLLLPLSMASLLHGYRLVFGSGVFYSTM